MNITGRIKGILSSSLHSNSLYLMLAQGVMTVFGYLFWVVNARLYDSTSVGLASTLISVSMLISQLSILGFNQALVRYLPKASDKNAYINTCLWITSIASLAGALLYVVGMHTFSPDLLFVREQPLLLLLFVVSMVLVTVNMFTDSVFLANRATKYNVIIYTAYSIIRLALPFAFISFGAMGIFGAHIAGVALAVIGSFYYMTRKFGYRPAWRIEFGIVRQLGKYSLSNYVAGFLWGVPLLIAPLLVVNHLGASPAAYFYMVMMIINILMIIPTSITQSLFAEGSHKEGEQLRHIIAKSLKLGLGIEAAAVAGACLLGSFVIGIFGKEYVQGGMGLLYIMAISSLLVVGNMVGNVVLKLKKRNAQLIAVNAFGAVVTTISFVVLLKHGLEGIGYGYLIGQALQLLAFAILFLPTLRRHRHEAVQSTAAD